MSYSTPPSAVNLIDFISDELQFTVAREEHAIDIHNIIKDAFSIWKERGLDLSPMRQSIEETTKHAVGKSYLISNKQEDLATISLGIGYLEVDASAEIQLTEDNTHQKFQFSGLEFIEGHYLIVKKFCVRSQSTQAGLGTKILRVMEDLGKQRNYQGIILETVAEATWLYDWYVKQGYKTVGSCVYPRSQYETLLMVKSYQLVGK